MILAEECTLNLSHEHWSKLKHKDMQKLNVSEHVMTIFKKNVSNWTNQYQISNIKEWMECNTNKLETHA